MNSLLLPPLLTYDIGSFRRFVKPDPLDPFHSRLQPGGFVKISNVEARSAIIISTFDCKFPRQGQSRSRRQPTILVNAHYGGTPRYYVIDYEESACLGGVIKAGGRG